jgi:hypothetical protein
VTVCRACIVAVMAPSNTADGAIDRAPPDTLSEIPDRRRDE